MRRPKIRELGEAINSIIHKPYTIKYPYEPSIPPETFRGKPKYVEEECIGCGACAQVCPAMAIKVIDTIASEAKQAQSLGTRRLTVHQDHCIFCGQCQRYCTTGKGILLSNEYDTATYDRSTAVAEVEKDLLVCEHCGEIIGAVDHIRWVAQKLGPKAYANLSLALILHKDLNLVSEIVPYPTTTSLGRADHVKFLCPKCQRELILSELWGP